MSLKRQLIESNLVIVANQFDLSTINSIWLLKKKIFSIDELQERFPLPIIVEARSADFIFVLDPNRLQFWIMPECNTANELLATKIAQLIKELPPQPYVASGFNFTYHIVSENRDFGELTRSLFCQPDSKLFNDFNTSDARFGGYFSKNIIGTRLRLEIKPIIFQQGNKTIGERLQFAFNFNMNISSEDKEQCILDFLQKWDEAKNITYTIMDKINERGENGKNWK